LLEVGSPPSIEGARKSGATLEQLVGESEPFKIVVRERDGRIMKPFRDRSLALLEALVGNGGEQLLPVGVGNGFALTSKGEDGQHLIGFTGVEVQLDAILGAEEPQPEGNRKQKHIITTPIPAESYDEPASRRADFGACAELRAG
jgi:hypothetical protein